MNASRSFGLVLLVLAPALAPGSAASAAPIPPGTTVQECATGSVPRGSACVPLSAATDAEVRTYLVRQSIRSYSGTCPCPYNVDRAGRRCGRRSAYSRPGGSAPLCYPSDVSDEAVRRARRQS